MKVKKHFKSNINTVLGNSANNNIWDGIRLHSSDNNTISGNTATNNGDGIHLYFLGVISSYYHKLYIQCIYFEGINISEFYTGQNTL
ncbi:MAG TPA: hypothetical protein ENI29_08335 [bacterium]|nr:hypothetical protein [bacterium]